LKNKSQNIDHGRWRRDQIRFNHGRFFKWLQVTSSRLHRKLLYCFIALRRL